jgi:hypothetical protein
VNLLDRYYFLQVYFINFRFLLLSYPSGVSNGRVRAYVGGATLTTSATFTMYTCTELAASDNMAAGDVTEKRFDTLI